MARQHRGTHSAASGLSQQKKSIGVVPIPPSRMGDRKRMWEFVHNLTKPEDNEELARVRSLAYKRADRDNGESRYLLKWLVPRCPRMAELDEEHQLILVDKIELLQFSDKDIYQDTCGVLVRGWMVRGDQSSNVVLGPGTCVDCMDHNVTYECWYGADNAAPEEIDRKRRKQSLDMIMGAGAFSKKMKSIASSTSKWKKKAHTRITEVIAFPVHSWEVVRETQRMDSIKKYVNVLKMNSKILGNWSKNRLFKLCDSGKVHELLEVGDTLFRQGDPLSKVESAFLVLTGSLRIQIRFTLKEAQRLAPKGIDYFCPPRYHQRTVVTLISILHSGDCLRPISIVDELWSDNDEKANAFESDDESDSEDDEEDSAEEEDVNALDSEERIITVVDRDNSGEIDYRELARAIKYGDPKRVKSMAEQEAKLIAISEKGAAAAAIILAKKKKDALDQKKLKDAQLAAAQLKPDVPECEVVAGSDNTTVLEVHKDSEAAGLLRRTGMARKLLEVDIGKFNRKKLIRQWVRNKHSLNTLKSGLEDSMGPRARNRREVERRAEASRRLKKTQSLPLLPSILPKKGVSARQQTALSNASPFSSRRQLRRFKKVVSDIRSSVPTMGFNPVVLWEEDRNKTGELIMKVITRAESGGLHVCRYPTKLGGEKPQLIKRYSL